MDMVNKQPRQEMVWLLNIKTMKKTIIKKDQSTLISVHDVEKLIVTIRGIQVLIDRDLASLYQVEVKQMNRQVKRNIERFPEDFMFQLTKEEYNSLKCPNGTSNTQTFLQPICALLTFLFVKFRIGHVSLPRAMARFGGQEYAIGNQFWNKTVTQMSRYLVQKFR